MVTLLKEKPVIGVWSGAKSCRPVILAMSKRNRMSSPSQYSLCMAMVGSRCGNHHVFAVSVFLWQKLL